MACPPAPDKKLPFADRMMLYGLNRPGKDIGEAPMNNKLKVLRAMRNWSQAELADRLDVSRQAVNAIETGKYDPSLPLAFKLARLFEIPIEEIFDDGHEGNEP